MREEEVNSFQTPDNEPLQPQSEEKVTRPDFKDEIKKLREIGAEEFKNRSLAFANRLLEVKKNEDDVYDSVEPMEDGSYVSYSDKGIQESVNPVPVILIRHKNSTNMSRLPINIYTHDYKEQKTYINAPFTEADVNFLDLIIAQQKIQASIERYNKLKDAFENIGIDVNNPQIFEENK